MSDHVIISIISTAGSIICAMISGVCLIVSRRTYALVNSRMDELLAAARAVAREEGRRESELTHAMRGVAPEVPAD